MHQDIKKYCNLCPKFHLVAPCRVGSVIRVPFERVATDLLGPLPKSATRFYYILIILDYATQFPEAILLQSIMARCIMEELPKVFALVGLSQEILTNQGASFTSWLLH